MTRIAYRDPAQMNVLARELTRARGNLNVYRTLANAEKVFTGWMQAGDAALTSPILPVRLREIAVLRTAYLMDSPYEIGQHRDVARTAGIKSEEVEAILSESGGQKLSLEPTERAVLQLTTEMVTTRTVSDDTFDGVRRTLGSEATVELLMIIGRYAGLALMLNVLDVDLDEDARLPIPRAGHAPV